MMYIEEADGFKITSHNLTIFDENPGDSPFDDLLGMMGCVYAWDPELRTFRRSCEGDT